MHYILPILIGAIIGYCTNYIAIKMLFRPRKALYLGKWKLPFTPGVIPKNQPRIAESVGRAVEGQLLTADDLVEKLGSSALKAEFAAGISQALCRSDKAITDVIPALKDSEGLKNALGEAVSGGILGAVKQADLMPIIQNICESAFGDLLHNPMVSLFLKEDMLNSLYQKADLSLRYYLEENCRPLVDGYLEAKLPELLAQPVREDLAALKVDEAMISGAAEAIFDNLITAYLPVLVQKLSVKQIVTDKINAMDVKELEALVMSVMKNELQAVVNLGAVIGAVIGIINIFT